jgi:hypothetical protein
MKSKIKLIGIIAFVAVIGLLLASCGDKEGTLKVKNERTSTIKVYASAGGDVTAAKLQEGTGTDITAGNTGSFTLDAGDASWLFVADGTASTVKKATIKKGEDTNVTVTATTN